MNTQYKSTKLKASQIIVNLTHDHDYSIYITEFNNVYLDEESNNIFFSTEEILTYYSECNPVIDSLIINNNLTINELLTEMYSINEDTTKKVRAFKLFMTAYYKS